MLNLLPIISLSVIAGAGSVGVAAGRSGTSASPTPQAARYEGFVFSWAVSLLGAEEAAERFPGTAKKKPAADPHVGAWPTVPKVGVFANGPHHRTKAKWIARGVSETPDPAPRALEDVVYWLRDCYDDQAAPARCVPGACLFEPRCEREVPPLWLAVRKHQGQEVLAGAFVQYGKTSKIKQERQRERWLKGLHAGFSASP